MRGAMIVALLGCSLTAAEPKPSARRPAPVKTDATALAVGDRVLFLHDRPEVTHVVATRRARDLRAKEILVGDGVEVGDVAEFFRSSRVPLASIPVGTTGVVREVVAPWAAGNEQGEARVQITSGTLAGQEWWANTSGLVVPGTSAGDRRIKIWRLLVRTGKVKDPETLRAYVTPEPPTGKSRAKSS